MDHTIYINSKGRFNTRYTTMRLLEAEGITGYIVAEPAEVEAYRVAYPGWTVLPTPGNNCGLMASRQTALDHARATGCVRIWIMDDDVTGFSRREGERLTPCTAREALDGARRVFATVPHFGLGCMEYRFTAWTGPLEVYRRKADVVICIDIPATRTVNYRTRLPKAVDDPDAVRMLTLKGDVDFAMQVLASGAMTVRTRRYAFSCPKNGRKKGGCKEVYDIDGMEMRACRLLERLWGPNVVKATRTVHTGRPTVKINWNHFTTYTTLGGRT